MSAGADSPVSAASSILEIRGAQEPEVSGNAVAGFDQNDIAGRQAFRRNREPPSVAHDRGLARQHGANRLERLFRPAFLDEADRRVDEDDGEDDHGVESVAQQHGDQRGRQEDIDEQVVELGEHARPQGAWLARRQSVWPVRLEPLRGLGRGQPLGRGLAALERGLDRFRVPGTFSNGDQILHPPMELRWRSIGARSRASGGEQGLVLNLAAPSGGRACLARPSRSR